VRFDLFRLDHQLARELRNAVVLQQPQVVAHERLAWRADQAEMPDLQQQTLLQIARADANRIELLNVIQRPLHQADVPVAQRGDLVHRGDQIPVVVDVADDGGADVAQRLVHRLQVELPHEVVGERALRGERVLDRRELFDFLRLARAVALVEILAEEILVVGVVPGLFLALGLLRLGLRLRSRGLFGGGILGRRLLEQRILHHLLVEEVGQLERRHRQQLDSLLQ
jgi:hypothetical protein